MDLKAPQSLKECVVAWEGDPDFDYEHQYGVWVYTPEFWGKDYMDGEDRLFEISDADIPGENYIYYPESIEGRWHGVDINLSVKGKDEDVLLPLANGMAASTSTDLAWCHAKVKKYGATFDSIYSWDKNALLYVVEYANMNSQNSLGFGVTMFPSSNHFHILEDVTEATAFKVNTSEVVNYKIIPGRLVGTGTVMLGIIVNTNENEEGVTTVTIDRPVTMKASTSYYSVNGLLNSIDKEIGSKSGYIGENGTSIAYYRGEELYGNGNFYTLGAWLDIDDNDNTVRHVWVARDIYDADDVDQLNTEIHIDTGIQVKATDSYIQTLARHENFSLLPFAIEFGGTSEGPVGDRSYLSNIGGASRAVHMGNFIPFARGFYEGLFSYSAPNLSWLDWDYFSARPCLLPPR